MQIVDLKPEDLEECAELYIKAFSTPPWNEKWKKEHAMKRLAFLFGLPGAKGEKYVIENRIVAFWIGFIEPFLEFESLSIKEVAVHPDLQRQGIGTKLSRSAEKYARSKGLKEISLSTADASKFYEKHGYKLLEKIVFMHKHFD